MLFWNNIFQGSSGCRASVKIWMCVQKTYLWTKYTSYIGRICMMRAHLQICQRQNDSTGPWSTWISPFLSTDSLSQPEDAALDAPRSWYSRSESPFCFYSLSIKTPSSLWSGLFHHCQFESYLLSLLLRVNITCKITAEEGVTRNSSKNAVSIRILFAKHLLQVIKFQDTL